MILILCAVALGTVLLHAQPALPQTPTAAPPPRILGIFFFAMLIGSGLMSACETALFSLDKLDISLMRGSHRWRERSILRLLDRPNDTLITILVINNVVNIAASLSAGALMTGVIGGESTLAFTLAAALATAGILFIGEIVPKMLAHLSPMRMARILSPPLVATAWTITPLRWAIRLGMRGLFRAFKIPEEAAGEDISEEELKAMIGSGEISQVLEQDEREMIDGVFELRGTSVDQILTPRLSVTAFPDDLGQEEMIARLRASTNSRVLIYHDTLDTLVGFLLVKEVLLEPERPWRELVREPVLVPERIGLLDLLQLFRRRRTKMAVVVDEYGAVAGIVTLQDLLEEIVGDIYEKHEHVQSEVVALEPGAHWKVSGAMDVDRLGEQLGAQFPTHLGRTVGGFVMNSLGRIPRVGDEVRQEPYVLRVQQMAGRRVHALDVTREAETGGDGGEEAAQ
ncbi:MAG: hemolysin family protein [Candidatus Sumerlaeia bacterium]